MKAGKSDKDIFQLSAYWLLNDDREAEAVLEYPMTGEKLVFDPQSNQNNFDPRERSGSVYKAREKALEAINQLRSLQSRYLENCDSREKATDKALSELEVS